MGDADLFDLTGRHAVVTGAAGLLGREFAGALAAQGAVVHLVDLDRDGLAAVAASIEAQGGHAVALPLDITDEAAVQAAVDALPRVDVLVNSAAIDPKVEPGAARRGHIATYPLDLWQASLDVNLTGSFLMARACCRRMQDQGENGSGVIVNVSSIYGLVGPDQRIYEGVAGDEEFFKPVDYSVTKAGILGLTRAVAAMYRGTGIRVNALTPGGTFNGQDDGFVERYSAKTVLDRMAVPQDYRGAIVFLCSDASSYMTGANLVVDGGWTAS